MKQTHAEPPTAKATEPRLSPLTDLVLRTGAVVLLIAGVIIGFSRPIAIVLVAIGVLLLVLDQGLRYWPRKPAH